MSRTTAIIAAAGSGTRLRSDTPKQFLELAGKPVIVHTLERFQAAPSVDAIVLVLAEDRIEAYRPETAQIAKVTGIVKGGDTRAESVLNGLTAVDRETAIVAVHDGARPFVSVDEIERTIAKAKQMGAACLVAPVTDTIKSIRGSEISATLDRQKLRRALTPQAFRIEVLRRAFEMADELDETVTDESYLVERLGHPIELVEGSSRNIKITHAEDLAIAEAMMSRDR